MDLLFSSPIPSMAGIDASKYYFYCVYIYTHISKIYQKLSILMLLIQRVTIDNNTYSYK